MHYEIHVTVQATSPIQFTADCEQIGVKPIIIETQNENLFEQQMMTSSKHTGEDYMPTLASIVSELESRCYKIVRKKIEIMPENEKHKDFIYYESHFRLKLPKVKDEVIMSKLKNYCNLFNWHYSKNLFKRSEEFDYQMITYRNSTINLYEFRLELDRMKSYLNDIGIVFDKIEIEEAIYDSNQNVDTSWLKKQNHGLETRES